jgi:hypothetical protein
MLRFDLGPLVELFVDLIGQPLLVLHFFLNQGQLLAVLVAHFKLPVRSVLVFYLAAFFAVLVAHLDRVIWSTE